MGSTIVESAKFNDFIPADGAIYNNNLYLIGENSSGQQLTAKIDFSTDSIHFLNSSNNRLSRIKVINTEMYAFTNEHSFGSIIKVDFDNASTVEKNNYSGSPINMFSVDSTRLLSICNGPSFGVKQFGEPQVGLLLFDTLLLNNSFCFQSSNYLSNLLTYSDTLINDTLLGNSSIASVSEPISVSWLNGNLFVGLGCVDYLDGIGENELDKSIVLVPNPSNSYFSINSDQTITANVEILNFNGQILKKQILDGTSITLQSDDLHNGIYVVRIRTEYGRVINKKLVIAH